MKKEEKIIIFFGSLLILIGVIFNEYVIGKLFASGNIIAFPNKVIIWIFEFFFLSFGLLILILRKKTNFCINILLVFFSIIFSLILSEIFLRFLEIKNLKIMNTEGKSILLSSPEYHHDYRPNQVFTNYSSKYDEFGPVENVINSFGIRGPEIPEKEDGEYRILLLGDSFIQAEEIEYEKTAGEILSKMSGEKNIKVIQHGMSSWSPLLELNWFSKKGLKLKPDLVVIFLCINDFYSSYSGSDLTYTKQAVFDSDGLPLSFRLEKTGNLRLLGLLRKFINSLFVNSINYTQQEIDYLLKIDKDLLNSTLNSKIPERSENSELVRDIIRLSRPVELWDEETIKEVSLSLKYLDGIKKITDDNNISLAITLVPLGWNVSKDENIEGRKHYGFSNITIPMGGIEDKIKRYCSENKVDYIDFFTAFKNFIEDSDQKLFLVSDGHWSDLGHKVAAEVIYKYLELKNKI